MKKETDLDYRYAKFNAARRHLAYETEQRWFEAIREGDLSLLMSNVELYRESDVGILSHAEEKQAEYQAVIAITLSTRAAIDGGVSAELAYEKSDLFMQELAGCSDISRMGEISQRAMIEFLRMVYDRKTSPAIGYIKQCKDFVTANYHENFSISDVAAAVGLNESYLCRLFKKSEGITLGDYIQREKIDIAKKMLRYTELSIADLADFLGYHSQSYFGKLFKKWCGMSPAQYRIQHRTAQFEKYEE